MRILMVNLPFAGHTNPTLPLAKALALKGAFDLLLYEMFFDPASRWWKSLLRQQNMAGLIRRMEEVAKA